MEEYWKLVLNLALKAAKKGEVPVGAIIVNKNKVIAKTYNKREKNNNILGHAEIMAIEKASKYLKTWKLTNCDLYVSMKPCSMCDNVIRQARIANVYYLVDKNVNKKEYYDTKFTNIKDESLIENYKQILKDFFCNLRK